MLKLATAVFPFVLAMSQSIVASVIWFICICVVPVVGTTSVTNLQINKPLGSEWPTTCLCLLSAIKPAVDWYTEVSQKRFLSCCYELTIFSQQNVLGVFN